MCNRFDHSRIKTSLMGTVLAGGVIVAASVYAEPINVTAERGVLVGDAVHGDFPSLRDAARWIRFLGFHGTA